MYLLSMIQPTGGVLPPEQLAPIMKEINAITDELKASNNWVFGGGLHDPDTATVVRAEGGEVVMTDGPFVEGKEFIGGFSIIKAPDLDAALAVASRLAKITKLPVEVRPFRESH
jgi:hypothetical protein